MTKKILCLLCSLLLLVSLCACKEKPSQVPSDDSDKQNEDNTEKSKLDKSAFSYEKLSAFEELKTADHIYRTYQDETRAVFSVCENFEETVSVGAPQKTVGFTVYSLAAGSAVLYSVSTEAYVLSAIPYENGVLYTDYVYHDGNSVSVKWSIRYTDGESNTVYDSGGADSDSDVPKLLLANGKAYYLVKNEDGYSIRKLEEGSPVTVHNETGCELFGMSGITSNGKQFCYLAEYPNDEFATFCVADTNGVLYRHKLSGKITSFTITDKYAVCGTGVEETKKHSLEVIDLATGKTELMPHIYGAFYCLSGTGSVLVVVNGGNWENLMAMDLEAFEPFAIESPQTDKLIQSNLIKNAGENTFLAQIYTENGYEFYLLKING